jgi:hypothetical protein
MCGRLNRLQMLQEEWACLMDAIKAERMKPAPYVLFVMAVKTHNMRMFDSQGERGNVRMGTVLTSHSGVTSAECNDWYMVAHRALQGTAKPLRYVMLKHGWTDPECTLPPPFEVTERKCARTVAGVHTRSNCAEMLVRELMPLHMMNARAQKACMLPAPVKFAHLAAERASVHIADRW